MSSSLLNYDSFSTTHGSAIEENSHGFPHQTLHVTDRMPEPSTPRRALQDLPVNTVGTPKALKLPSPAALYRKRSISEVDDPMLAPDSARVRGKDHEQIPVQEVIKIALCSYSSS